MQRIPNSKQVNVYCNEILFSLCFFKKNLLFLGDRVSTAVHRLFVVTYGLPLVGEHTGFSLRCFSCHGALALDPTGFSSCITWAQSLWNGGSVAAAQGLSFLDMWDLPRPGIEPMSPALAGGFLTTRPPEKFSPNPLPCFLLLLQDIH